jgi:HSP20 family molecular chaperone IbpA
MATQGKVNVPLTATNTADTKIVPAVNNSQQAHHIHPIVAVNPWAHPNNTMMTPFSNILGNFGSNEPGSVLNIFDKEMSHLNRLAGHAAVLTVDVVEKENELEVDAHIGAPKESKFFHVVHAIVRPCAPHLHAMTCHVVRPTFTLTNSSFPPYPPHPGVTLEHDADHLYITATRSGQSDKNDRYVSRHESWSGTTSRTIYVGQNFDLANMSQSFEHGRLKIKIPRVGGSRKLVTL